MTMIYRSAGSALTNNEIDANFKTVEDRYIGSALASAATLTLTNEYNYFLISGNTDISKINDVLNGAGAYGTKVVFRFESAGGAIGHATQIVMPGGETTVTWAIDDIAVFVNDAANVWRCISYQPASVSVTEERYLDGVTAAIQTQLDEKPHRNLIINGMMRVWQRDNSFTTIASTAYTADCWEYFVAGTGRADVTEDAQVVGDGTEFDSAYKIDVTTADAAVAVSDVIGMLQRIEGNNAQQLQFGKASAKTVTLSFWHKHTKTGTYCVALRNSAKDRSYVAEYTQSVTDTWEKSEVTIAGDTSGTWLYGTGIGLTVSFALMAGTNFQTTVDTWTAGNFIASSSQVNAFDNVANNMLFSAIQLEAGSVATEFESRSFDTELARCKRYYEKSYTYGVPAGTNTNNGAEWFAAGKAYTSTQFMRSVDFSNGKRVPPTITVFPIDGASAGNVTTSVDGEVSASANAIGTSGYVLQNTSGGALTDGQTIGWQWVANSEL